MTTQRVPREPPPAPQAAAIALRPMFQLRSCGARRWPHALRTALCVGLPVMTGVVYDDIAAGLLVSLTSSLRQAIPPTDVGPLPVFLWVELDNLQRALRAKTSQAIRSREIDIIAV